ncbi:MAG: ribonuclease G [Gammaproteobacteria bacterium]|nr:ribonuclease G [Gammaproteobacteria bacterium]MBV9696522.1 ribonuclease G [Gammaproteobacteria bacterium]
MSIEILVNVGPRESRAAVLENGVVQEVHIERASRRGLVSNLYKGRVSRVLPGMQAAFVEIGLERTAFLHAADIAAGATPDTVSEAAAAGGGPPEDIRRLVNAGDEILVQVIKDPIGTKGARLTTFIALPSRYLVYLPRGQAIGVSARIEDEAERTRLKSLLGELLGAGRDGGYIIRTAAQGAGADGLREDIGYLGKLWEHVRAAGAAAAPGTVVHEDLPLSLRVLRDELARGVSRVLVDSEAELARMRDFTATFMPGGAPSLELYAGPRPLFDTNGVEEELSRALERKVPLKSGGYLMIDQTESMTTIDVNTGAYVGHRDLEETIFRTNLEAAVGIARQLRLRNLGGIIIIDFIDMREEPHRRAVLAALERALAGDRAQTHIVSLSPLGLVEMTRKRTRESLEHLLCAPCPSCEGRGFIRTPETVCNEIFREIVRQSRQFATRELLILAHQDVVERLLDEEAPALAELEAQVGRPIRLQVEALYGVDQYDVVLV